MTRTRSSLAVSLSVIAAAVFSAAAGVSHAQSLKVENVWARATVPGQKIGGVYLDLTSSSEAAVIAAATPIAAHAELHSMTMDGGVMRMRALPRVELPQGKTVRFTPGGMHIMLVDLKQPLKVGEKVPLTLSIQAAGASPTTLKLDVPVLTAAPAAASHDHAH